MSCKQCGGQLMTGDIEGICVNCKSYQNKKVIWQGWQCPVCLNVYSPFVTQCTNNHGQYVNSSSINANKTRYP